MESYDSLLFCQQYRAMSRWVLNCPECKQEFTHTEIAKGSGIGALEHLAGGPYKPDFPRGGLKTVRELRERARWIMEIGEGLEITGTPRAQQKQSEVKPN